MLHVVASRGVLCVVGVEAFAMMVPEATATIVHCAYLLRGRFKLFS
jgi:hypothetical protein